VTFTAGVTFSQSDVASFAAQLQAAAQVCMHVWTHVRFGDMQWQVRVVGEWWSLSVV
jgi:hypothetical protein